MHQIERINNFKDCRDEVFFPSWKKGQGQREKILKLIEENPTLTVEAIAAAIELSPRQVDRHRKNLVAAGLWKIGACGMLMLSAFGAGAYYADSGTLDEWIESHIEFPIQEIREEILWKLQGIEKPNLL